MTPSSKQNHKKVLLEKKFLNSYHYVGATDHQESEINEKMEDEKSGEEDDDGESVDSFEQKKRQFNFNKPKAWEFQPVKVANVWDFMPDLVVYKWVKGIR